MHTEKCRWTKGTKQKNWRCNRYCQYQTLCIYSENEQILQYIKNFSKFLHKHNKYSTIRNHSTQTAAKNTEPTRNEKLSVTSYSHQKAANYSFLTGWCLRQSQLGVSTDLTEQISRRFPEDSRSNFKKNPGHVCVASACYTMYRIYWFAK